MSSKKVLALDADGVLLNYLNGFLNYCRKTGREIYCEDHEVDSWSMRRAFGISNNDPTHDEFIMDRIREFSRSEDFAHIPYITGAIDAVHYLKSLTDELSVIAITSAGTDEVTIRRRHENLRSFPFDAIHVLPLGSSKKEYLRDLPAGSVFVDDLYDHVLAAEEVGVQGVLFRQPYNLNVNATYVIENWQEGQLLIEKLLLPSSELETAL